MDAYLAIVSKREVREYSDQPIPDELKRRILEAGRVTGSSANKQQWRFFVVASEDKRERLAELVYVSNNLRAAKLVIAIAVQGSGPTTFDAGRAAQNMMLAAWNFGVGSCPNGSPDRDAVSDLLGLDEGEEVAIILTFGYPAKRLDPERRSPDEWIRRANRKPFEKVVVEV